jgi:hypothetical protein
MRRAAAAAGAAQKEGGEVGLGLLGQSSSCAAFVHAACPQKPRGCDATGACAYTREGFVLSLIFFCLMRRDVFHLQWGRADAGDDDGTGCKMDLGTAGPLRTPFSRMIGCPGQGLFPRCGAKMSDMSERIVGW